MLGGNVPFSLKKNQPYPGLHQKQHGHRVTEIVPIYFAFVQPHLNLCSTLGSPAPEGHRFVGGSPEEGHKGNQRAGPRIL